MNKRRSTLLWLSAIRSDLRMRSFFCVQQARCPDDASSSNSASNERTLCRHSNSLLTTLEKMRSKLWINVTLSMQKRLRCVSKSISSQLTTSFNSMSPSSEGLRCFSSDDRSAYHTLYRCLLSATNPQFFITAMN